MYPVKLEGFNMRKMLVLLVPVLGIIFLVGWCLFRLGALRHNKNEVKKGRMEITVPLGVEILEPQVRQSHLRFTPTSLLQRPLVTWKDSG